MANEQIESGLLSENVKTNSERMEGAADNKTNENSSNESQSTSHSNDNAWIGGVKKEARQKGYQEGYQKALDEIKQKFALHEDQTPEQSPTTSAAHNATQSTSNSLNPENIAMQAAQLAAQRNKQDHYTNIGNRAIAKYGDDYVQKMNEYNKIAEKMASEHKNDDMATAILLAAEIGNEDLVYKLASDEKFRNDLLSTNPRLWGQKLLNHQINSPQTAQQMASQKVNGKPNENMPQSASYGEFSEMSWEERRRRVREQDKKSSY